MDAITQSLYGLHLAPYLFGALAFATFFALLMRRRARIIRPRRLWILPSLVWIIAAAEVAKALPQTGTQVVGFLVLGATGLGIGVLLCLSDSLKHDPIAVRFTHKSSILSNGAMSLIAALLIGFNPANIGPAAVFIAGLLTGRALCLWRWSGVLRKAPEVFHIAM